MIKCLIEFLDIMFTSAHIRKFLRKKRIAVIAVILCTIFLLYQLLNIVALTSSVRENENNRIAERFHADDNQWPHETLMDSSRNGLNHIPDRFRSPKKMALKKKLKEIQGKIVLGVSKFNYKAYQDTGHGEFFCISSGEKIPYNQLNDDYCDCEDGSDEPSTGACSDSRFYCTVKTFTGKDNIPASMVNDGICDCCDGSDEWLNKTHQFIPPISQLNLKNKQRIHFTPCIWRCS